MPALEFVWVQHCEVCGCEHRHMEHHEASPGSGDAQSEAFRERCQTWYRAHLDAAQAFESPMPT